jgi:predicted dinucleotide-binding enzyme
MSYAIIGFGSIGQALAKSFARKGISVLVATTRNPDTFASTAAAIGPTIQSRTLSEAIKADTIFLAVRFESHQDVAKMMSSWKGKTIIDVTNTQVSPEELGGLPSSKVIEQAFNGARLVKGFNHLIAAKLAQDPSVNGLKRAVFLSSDVEDAAKDVGELAEKLGYSPINLGKLSEGGMLVQARGKVWGPLIFKDLARI